MTPHLATLDQLDGASDVDCRLSGSARALKPFWALPNALVDECRLTVGETVRTQLRDPANVAEADITLFPEALDSYDAPAESFTIGLLVDELTSRFNHVRSGKHTADDVTLNLTPTATEVTARREYDSATAERRDILRSLDADSVRSHDDPLSGRGLDFSASASVGVPVLADTIEHLDRVESYVSIAHDSGDLLLGNEQTTAEGDETETRAGHETCVESVADGEEVGALFSLDYVSDIVEGLHKARIETVELAWDDSFPVKVHGERVVDGETWYSADYYIAPRIEGGGR